MRDVQARLAVFDIDGTLLDSANPISDETNDALRGLRDRGIQIAFASSRPIGSLELLARDVEIPAHLIGFNGALAVSVAGQELIAETFVIEDRLTAILRGFADEGGLVNVYRRSHWLAVGPPAAIDHEERATGLTAHSRPSPDGLADLAGDSCLKVMCRGSAAACARLPSDIAHFPKLTALASGWDCCDIQADGTDKARALRELCRSLGITPDQVAAFGDSDSDASMLQLAGYGVAVGAASDRARAAADEHIDGPGSSALAEWLDGIAASS